MAANFSDPYVDAVTFPRRGQSQRRSPQRDFLYGGGDSSWQSWNKSTGWSGYWLLAAAALLVVIGIGIVASNRGSTPGLG
jgi:hypothetical protein